THIAVPDAAKENDLVLFDRLLRKTDPWERELQAKLKDRVVTAEQIAARPSEYLVQLDFWHLPELVDLRPPPGSPFIHSKSEPFEEDDVNAAVLQHWLDPFAKRLDFRASRGHGARRSGTPCGRAGRTTDVSRTRKPRFLAQ